MSHTETRLLTATAEVILLRGAGPSRDKGLRRALCNVAAEIHARTGALVIVDHLGEMDLSKVDPAEMRRFGWVRIEELRRAEAVADDGSRGLREAGT